MRHKDPDDDRDVDYYGAFERERKEEKENEKRRLQLLHDGIQDALPAPD